MRDGQGEISHLKPVNFLPDWVPPAARLYLSHTESGLSLRQIARDEGLHASTVLRQVRRFENRRDDFLIDCALGRLKNATPTTTVSEEETDNRSGKGEKMIAPSNPKQGDEVLLDDARLMSEAIRVLRRLCEPGAVLAVAAAMDRAVVLRDSPEGAVRLAVLDRPVAEAFALRDWITCRKPGRVTQYEITSTGRAMLRRLMAQAPGATVDGVECGRGDGTDAMPDAGERGRPALGETPVMALAGEVIELLEIVEGRCPTGR